MCVRARKIKTYLYTLLVACELYEEYNAGEPLKNQKNVKQFGCEVIQKSQENNLYIVHYEHRASHWTRDALLTRANFRTVL